RTCTPSRSFRASRCDACCARTETSGRGRAYSESSASAPSPLVPHPSPLVVPRPSFMSRIALTFAKLKSANRKALIPFITAGAPDPATTVPLMLALVQSGADIIELGVPSSDPMADGPTIQRASERALKHRTSLKLVLETVARFRRTDTATPVVLMGYANPI